jgi:hypothetical protein
MLTASTLSQDEGSSRLVSAPRAPVLLPADVQIRQYRQSPGLSISAVWPIAAHLPKVDTS